MAEITVGVIDDDIFEEDEYFYVHLSNPRVVGHPEVGTAPLDASVTPKAVLGDNHTATVTIYDDDHAGETENLQRTFPRPFIVQPGLLSSYRSGFNFSRLSVSPLQS